VRPDTVPGEPCLHVVVAVDSLPPRLGKKADARRPMVAASRKLAGLVPISVQLAFARQDAKERGERDDAGRRSDDSYSPRRHWCFKDPDFGSKGLGPAYRSLMAFRQADDLVYEFATYTASPGRPA
jgi:hypothetical protein